MIILFWALSILTVEVDHETRRRPIPSRNIASSSSNQLPVTLSSTVLSIGATLPAAIFNSRRYTPGWRRRLLVADGNSTANSKRHFSFAKPSISAKSARFSGSIIRPKEHFLLLAMNNKNRVNGFKVVSTGSLTASLVHPREVWRAGLYPCAAAVIFVHTHPSGEPAPSQEDQEITRRLKETGEMLGIRVLDHVVLGDGRFFSFSDRGLI